jgi:methyl-accepting chemotaxis protein
MVRNIATAAEQQSSTSEAINTNVTGINTLSQNISRSINEASASIHEVGHGPEAQPAGGEVQGRLALASGPPIC